MPALSVSQLRDNWPLAKGRALSSWNDTELLEPRRAVGIQRYEDFFFFFI